MVGKSVVRGRREGRDQAQGAVVFMGAVVTTSGDRGWTEDRKPNAQLKGIMGTCCIITPRRAGRGYSRGHGLQNWEVSEEGGVVS